jgi:hypothetical protein
MEDLISQITAEKDLNRQKKLIIKLMKVTDYSHPSFLPVLIEFKLTPEELQEKEHSETYITADQKSVLLSHHEARRLAKVEVIAEVIQQRNIFSNKFRSKSKKTLQSSPSKNFKSYKNILESEPDIPLAIPLNQNVVSQRQIESQHKKLERLLKVSENIKTLKIEEEKRKKHLDLDFEEKSEKLKQVHQIAEEERNKKKIEADSKRQSKLRKKYQVRFRKELDNKELQVIEEEFRKVQRKKNNHERSKTSLTVRPNNHSQ